MLGSEVVAIISVSIAGTATLMTCFHSRCTKIKTPCFECDRKLFDEDEVKNHRKKNNINLPEINNLTQE